MSVNAFSVPRNIIYGEGSMAKLSELTGKKAVLVTGGNSMKRFGFLDEAKNLLEQAGIETAIIDGVEPNPSVETVRRGAEEMLAFEPEWLIAIGGGSALDAAKVMWCFYEHPELSFEDIITPGSMPTLRNKAKFIAIPSTSGTASEITAFSVITDTAAHITANTGMDVMAHAVETVASTAATSFTTPYAVVAIKLVIANLETAYTDPENMEARTAMHNASALAGMAFTNASLGLVHSLAHKIGGEFGVTHGLSNAILIPYIIEYNKQFTDAYAQVEHLIGAVSTFGLLCIDRFKFHRASYS